MPKKKKLVKKSVKRRVTIGTRTNRNSKKHSFRKAVSKKKRKPRLTKRRVFGKKTQSRRQRATKKRQRRYRRRYQVGGDIAALHSVQAVRIDQAGLVCTYEVNAANENEYI